MRINWPWKARYTNEAYTTTGAAGTVSEGTLVGTGDSREFDRGDSDSLGDSAPITAKDIADELFERASAAAGSSYKPSDYTGGFSPMVGAPVVPPAAQKALAGQINTAYQDPKVYKPGWPGAYKWDHPLWWTVPVNPIRRPQSPLSLDQLRLFADRYDIIRSAINYIKTEVTSTPGQWQPLVKGDKSAQTQAGIDEMTAFMQIPGGLGGDGVTRRAFEMSVLEDLCVLGCTAIWLPVSNGGSPLQAIDIDAATIRPRVNSFGWSVDKSDYRYEQWIYGTIQALFYADDLVYNGVYKTSRSPYYTAPLEWLLKQIQMAVGYDNWNISWLQDGNTADAWIEAPESWTPDNLYTYTAYLDALLAGNLSERVKVKLLAPGSKIQQRGTKHDMEFISGEEWLARRCCALWGVHMSALGFAGDQYAANQSNAQRSTSSFGSGRLLAVMKEIYDLLAVRRGHVGIEWKWQPRDLAAMAQLAEIHSTYIQAGAMTPNEAREDVDREPYQDQDNGNAADRLYMNGTMRPIEDVESAASDQMAQAQAQAQAAPGTPNGKGAGGVRGNARATKDRERQNAKR